MFPLGQGELCCSVRMRGCNPASHKICNNYDCTQGSPSQTLLKVQQIYIMTMHFEVSSVVSMPGNAHILEIRYSAV